MKAAISVIILYKWHVILKIAGQKSKFYVLTTITFGHINRETDASLKSCKNWKFY